jgi:hypothetical protein
MASFIHINDDSTSESIIRIAVGMKVCVRLRLFDQLINGGPGRKTFYPRQIGGNYENIITAAHESDRVSALLAKFIGGAAMAICSLISHSRLSRLPRVPPR